MAAVVSQTITVVKLVKVAWCKAANRVISKTVVKTAPQATVQTTAKMVAKTARSDVQNQRASQLQSFLIVRLRNLARVSKIAATK